MSADSLMLLLGEIDGRPCYWAEPGRFERPGFWFWDGTKNVHVPLPPKAAEPEQPSANGATPRPAPGTIPRAP